MKRSLPPDRVHGTHVIRGIRTWSGRGENSARTPWAIPRRDLFVARSGGRETGLDSAYGKVTPARRLDSEDQMGRMRHLPLREQVDYFNPNASWPLCLLRIVGNFRAVQRVHRAVEREWLKMLKYPQLEGRDLVERNLSRSRPGFPCSARSCISLMRSCNAIATLGINF
jgi:hypothetical protein